ncbi:MAG: prepilin-type N-terminal cleavage/methylation domain-containing protein [Planctomycetes bacterium]|nr:prepilin-type N-terminal cleavage/methylation domain-containing protein [Planctomycetota bacterium]
MSRRRFTLIEMLVVVAIVAILAAMLSPALHNALQAAKGVACANNNKQLGILHAAWSGDNRGYVCNAARTPLVDSGDFNHAWGYGVSQPGGGTWDVLLAELDGGGSLGLYACPADAVSPEAEVVRPGGAKLRARRSYVMPIPHHQSGSHMFPEIRRTRVTACFREKPWNFSALLGRLPNPSGTALLFENHCATGNEWFGSFWQLNNAFRINPFRYTMAHRDAATILFADGHVKGLHISEAVGTGSYGTTDGDDGNPKGVFTTTAGD